MSKHGSHDVHVNYVLKRSDYLWRLHRARQAQMARIRAILDGGVGGIQALLGAHIEEEQAHSIPSLNLMLSGVSRFAHRLGRLPDLRVDPPNETDSRRGKKRAEKVERVVLSLDETDELELMMPQLARWVVGYGYAPMVVSDAYDAYGNPYPGMELRDPYQCAPSEWTARQQPHDIAFFRRVPVETLLEMYPEHRARILGPGGKAAVGTGGEGAFDMPGAYLDGRSWENVAGAGAVVVEHVDREGTSLVLAERGLLLNFVPNLVKSGPPFYVFKRFSFNQLQGQFDHVLGLMAAIAKMNTLSVIAMEDATFAETNVMGTPLDQSKPYRKGRNAVNFFDFNTRVEKSGQNLPYQMFQEIDRLERQLRVTSGYSIQADGESPNSFVTGRGLDELRSGYDQELREYQTVFRRGLMRLDSIRLEHAEAAWPNRELPIVGARKGTPFAETYVPGKHVNGLYRTRRWYGAMAGFDDATKIVTGLQLVQGEIISRETMMENIDGLENITRELKRIDASKSKAVLMDGLAMAVQNGDQRAIFALIEMLPEGDDKTALKKYYTPQEPQMSPEEQAMLEMQQGGGQQVPATPPDVATVLSQLQMGGDVRGGVQTVGRL